MHPPQGSIRIRPPRRRLAGLALGPVALAAALAGCGGGGETPAVPVADDCLQSWNAESVSRTFGRHVYDTHRAKQAQVTTLEPSKGATTISGNETCAVVFAVAEDDFEYGDVGLVVTDLGWASLEELARGEKARLRGIQRDAFEAPNANLFPDGTLDPL